MNALYTTLKGIEPYVTVRSSVSASTQASIMTTVTDTVHTLVQPFTM